MLWFERFNESRTRLQKAKLWAEEPPRTTWFLGDLEQDRFLKGVWGNLTSLLNLADLTGVGPVFGGWGI